MVNEKGSNRSVSSVFLPESKMLKETKKIENVSLISENIRLQ